MIKLSVPDMDCGGCAKSIEKAIRGLDDAAVVTIDLAAHLVTVETGRDAAAVTQAVYDAGFTPKAA